MKKHLELSVVVITKNEAARMPGFFAALRHLKARHEILVLDSASTDKTAALARGQGARVKQVKWQGYAKTKNDGFKHARAPWVLSLDADEQPDPELCRAITQAVRQAEPECWSLNRLNYFLGEPVWRGGWHPDWQLRLFKKGKARFNTRKVHEGMEATAAQKPGRLQGLLHHHSYPDLAGYVDRLNRYTTLQAEELFDSQGAKPKTAVFRMLTDPFWVFFKMALLKGSFLEGRRGLYLAALSASSTFWKYAKWWHKSWLALGGKPGTPFAYQGSPWEKKPEKAYWEPKP